MIQGSLMDGVRCIEYIPRTTKKLISDMIAETHHKVLFSQKKNQINSKTLMRIDMTAIIILKTPFFTEAFFSIVVACVFISFLQINRMIKTTKYYITINIRVWILKRGYLSYSNFIRSSKTKLKSAASDESMLP